MALTSLPSSARPRADYHDTILEPVGEPVDSNPARMLSVMRIAAALAFMLHGTQKLLGYPPMDQPRPPIFSLLGLAGMLELFGGGMLVLGLFTQPVAVVLCLEMAIAYTIVHLPQGVLPILNGGEPAYLFGIVFLYIAFAGGGAWSMDRALRVVDEPVTVAD